MRENKKMNNRCILMLLIVGLLPFYSCHDSSSNSTVPDFDKLYVASQGGDRVIILNASTLEEIERVDIILGTEIPSDPHYVALDEDNGYWFVSAIAEDKIAMYSMETNELINFIDVDEDPAILELNIYSKKLYSSRMMLGMFGGSEASLIDEIDYNADGMNEFYETHDSATSTPHGLSLSEGGTILLTAGNRTDFLSRINTMTGQVDYVPMDPETNDVPTIPAGHLKPLEIIQRDGYAYITCTGGDDTNGQVQVWDISSLEKVDSYEFGVNSRPWHIELSPFEDKVYVVLSGIEGYDTAGVACLSFDGTTLTRDWETPQNSDYLALHGIAISKDGQYVYVSSRGNGNIYQFDANTGVENISKNYEMGGLAGIAITK